MEVPSGSIYKHLFEAQTQLANTLENTKQKRKDSQTSRTLNWNSKNEPSKSDVTKRGTEDNQNEIDLMESIEIDRNYYEETDVDRVRELDDDIERSRVSASSAKGQGDQTQTQSKTITERLAEKRLLKHSAALAKLDENLNTVKTQTESDLKISMAQATQTIQNRITMAKGLLQPLESEGNENILYQRTFESLEDQWQAVRNIFCELKADIQEVSDNIDKIEKGRSQHLTSLLLSARKELTRIAYLNDSDVIRLVAELITALNKSLMENRKYFSDIIARLARHLVAEQLNSHIFYQKHLLIWRKQYISFVVEKFRKFISSKEISTPEDQEENFEKLKNYHKNCWQKMRDDNFEVIYTDFKPPASTKLEATKIIDKFESLREELNSKNMKFLQDSIISFRDSEQKRSIQIANLKDELLDKNICDQEEVKEVEKEQLLVISHEISNKHAKIIKNTSIFMEDSSIRFKAQIDTIRRLLLALARVWDIHRDKCKNLDTVMLTDFNKQKASFKQSISIREQNLENTLKKLRQQTTDDQLGHSMNQVEIQLKQIKQSFKDYEKVQIEKLNLFDPKFEKEAKIYVKEVRNFFNSLNEFLKGPNVADSCNDEALQLFEAVKKIEATVLNENDDLDSEIESLKSSLNLTVEGASRPTTANSMASSRFGGSQVRPKTSWSLRAGSRTTGGVTSETGSIGLTGGRQLYIDQLMDEAESSQPTRTLLLDIKARTNPDQKLTFEDIPAYIRPMVLLDEDITKTVENIKNIFISHTEKYEEISSKNYLDNTAKLISQMKDEINLELQLYEQRPNEVRQHVYGERKNEVDEHKLRVQRHLRAINESLDELKFKYQTTENEILKGQQKYIDWIKSQEPIVATKKKSEEIVRILENMKSFMTKRKKLLGETGENFKAFLAKEISEIKGSNKKLIGTFKVFDDGGNFSQEEVTNLRFRVRESVFLFFNFYKVSEYPDN